MEKYCWIDGYVSSKAGVQKDFKVEWNWQRYSVGGKMFLALCYGDGGELVYITFKLEPLKGELLRRQYEDIIPGYYMNKTHWNSLKAGGNVPDDLLKDMIDESYDLVLSGLSKKVRDGFFRT